MSARDRRLAQTRYAGRESASEKAARKAREKEEKQNRRHVVPQQSGEDRRPKGTVYTAKDGRPIEEWYEEYRQTEKSRRRRTPWARSKGAKEAASRATLI